MLTLSVKRFLLVLTAVLLFGVQSVTAGELSPSDVQAFKSARASGQLVEQPSGYLVLGPGGSNALKPLMTRVNSLRRQKYQSLARKNGVPLSEVEKTAGRRLTRR